MVTLLLISIRNDNINTGIDTHNIGGGTCKNNIYSCINNNNGGDDTINANNYE